VKSTQRTREEGRSEGARDGKEGSSWVDAYDGVCVFGWKGRCDDEGRKRSRTVPFRFCLEKMCHPNIQ
jgi:hypothetical protein